jgi:ABC-type sugar transport system ATPase subunit
VTTATEPLLKCTDVAKFYGALAALQRISFEAFAGELICLIGDNGAGKSTLVKTITGLQHPDSGEIWFDGERIDRLSAHEVRRRGIETVYQDLGLCDNLSAEANIVLGREPVRFKVLGFPVLDKKEAAAIAAAGLDSLGISIPDLRAPIRTMSGGQRQAVGIARALAYGAKIIILDEPTAALGVHQTAAVQTAIRKTVEQGMLAIVISHNLDEVVNLASRVIAFRHGHVMLDKQIGATSREEIVSAMTGLRLSAAPNGQPT